MRHIVVIALFFFALVACAQVPPTNSPPTPDAKATEQRIAQNIFATLTASAPTQTPTITLTPTPEKTYTPLIPAWQATNTAIFATLIAATPKPTATSGPHDIVLSDTLTAEEKRMLKDALEHLRNCAPSLYNYVGSHVKLVTRGTRPVSKDTIGYVLSGESTIYLPQGTILGDNTYLDSARTFLTAANLVHEARHIDLGDVSTEQDAYRFELQVYIPQCYPNDIDPAVFVSLRQEVESRSR